MAGAPSWEGGGLKPHFCSVRLRGQPPGCMASRYERVESLMDTCGFESRQPVAFTIRKVNMKYTLEELIEAGVYIPAGLDEDGEVMYACDYQKAREYVPEIYIEEVKALDEAILAAVDSGDIELDWKFDDEGNPVVEYIARL